MKIRYSLRTLFLGTMVITNMMWVYFESSAWYSDAQESKTFNGQTYAPWRNENDLPLPFPFDSQDHTRRIFYVAYSPPYLCEANVSKVIFIFPEYRGERRLAPAGFIDDDTILFILSEKNFSTDNPEPTFIKWHRRFPEWWWGHFYRKEVWIFALLFALLIWSATRRIHS